MTWDQEENTDVEQACEEEGWRKDYYWEGCQSVYDQINLSQNIGPWISSE